MTAAACNRGSSLAVDLGPLAARPEADSFVLSQQLKPTSRRKCGRSSDSSWDGRRNGRPMGAETDLAPPNWGGLAPELARRCNFWAEMKHLRPLWLALRAWLGRNGVMTATQRPIAGYASPERSLEHCLCLEDSPEAMLLSLGADIRHLSGGRPFSVELALREQVFVLLLEGFRLQPLPGGLKGLVPPQPGPRPGPGQSSWLAARAPLWPPAPATEQRVATLLQAGMGWVQVEGQAAALCFPSPPQAPALNSSLPADSAAARGCGDRLPRAAAEVHPCRSSGDRWL
jgi:hypothetical protein